MWYCLPDSSLLLSYNPETASRVTLATLGIVFQTNLLTNNKLGTEYWLPDKTSYQLQTWSAVWKTVPSAARVTRDEVSGLRIIKGELSGRQYPIDMLTRLWLARHFKIYHGQQSI